MFRMILVAAGFFGLMYLLYINGIVVLRNKQALAFRCSHGGRQVRFSRCTGVLTRIVRFREEGTRRFVLRTALTAGDVHIQLQDSERRPLLDLDGATPEGEVFLNGKERYRLVATILSASGRYDIDWE